MYRILPFLLVFCSLPLLAQRISLPKPVVIKITATWCNVCGLHFWDDFKFIVEEFERDAVIMAVHASPISQLHNPTAAAISDNLIGQLGQPEYYLNGEFIEGNWISSTRDYIENLQSFPPIAHVSISHELQGDSIYSSATIQFEKSSKREYYLGLYIVENQVEAFQNNRAPTEKHSKILRTQFGEHPFGTLLTDADISRNDKFDIQNRIAIDSTWNKEQIEISAILWEKVGDRYVVTNANASLTTSAISTAVSPTLLNDVQFQIHPTITKEEAIIHLQLPNRLPAASMDVYDLNGTFISTIYQGTINAGNTTFALDLPTTLPNGVYFLQLHASGDSMVRKLILKK